ncbi:hypothetical protein SFRURICE_007762 [Spodoptera frugiperda]|nr:hypothetical protein SFRURICE_007762 [Spodoptera frugiperda]
MVTDFEILCYRDTKSESCLMAGDKRRVITAKLPNTGNTVPVACVLNTGRPREYHDGGPLPALFRGGGAREGINLLTPQPSRETLRASRIAGRSPATVSAGLRTASKASSPPDQNQTRSCGALRSARASKSHQTTTDGVQ